MPKSHWAGERSSEVSVMQWLLGCLIYSGKEQHSYRCRTSRMIQSLLIEWLADWLINWLTDWLLGGLIWFLLLVSWLLIDWLLCVQDKGAPFTEVESFQDIPFQSLLAGEDPSAVDLVKQAGADGFSMDCKPLFQVSKTSRVLPSPPFPPPPGKKLEPVVSHFPLSQCTVPPSP